ncbi:MAG: hypothetical protein F2667_01310 [Actinobacteria bacterium]|uniref:Unannotated protein n=1 Tax=freshwater metagenome TaxID=449393 RepID=A0A6J6NNX8_9ZZZZ|nr:hypothetical protein [Actinomycetota bacterium]
MPIDPFPYGPFPTTREWYDDDPRDATTLDRLTHLVLVDGRLVDTWSEPVDGTRWQSHADRFDRELRRPEPTPPPPAPYVQALDWLSEVCGGPQAVATLSSDALTDDAIDLPTEYATPGERTRTEAVAELLDAVAARSFDPETSYAFRHALLALQRLDPDTLSRARSAAQVAGGICWAVGKANGLLAPTGPVRVGGIRDALGCSATLSTSGEIVRAGLVGFRRRSDRSHLLPRGLPDLLPLGRVDVLLGSTRERLVRVRDRAEEARTAA